MARQRQQRRRPMFYGGPDPITLHKMQEILRNGRDLVNQRNAMFQQMNNHKGINGPTSNVLEGDGGISTLQRRRSLEQELDPRRNMAVDCGWPDWVSPESYKYLIDRDPLAGFVNSVYPLETCQVEPIIFEEDDEKITTGFEETLSQVTETIRSEPSYHDTDTGSILNQIFMNLDLLSGYSRFGGLLVGIDDGRELSEPAVPKKGRICKFLRPFPEQMCRITSFDMDRNSPRFGYPTEYQVTFADAQDMSATGPNESYISQNVHWSRIVHVLDRWHHPSASNVFAIERLRPVLNPVLDARKIRGSSAEGYYQACFAALHFGTHPALGPDVDIDRDSVLDMYEQFANGLQRIFVTSGLTVDEIQRALPDPDKHLVLQYIIILMKMRIPMRIAMGSEEGKLASGDDKRKWVKRLSSRHRYHNTPHIIVPVLDRLINLGCIERPKTRYQVRWPEIDLDTAQERMDALFKRAQAYGQYASNDVERFVTPEAFMSKFDSFTLGEARVMVEEADAYMEEVQDERNKQLATEVLIESAVQPAPAPVAGVANHQELKTTAATSGRRIRKKGKSKPPEPKVPKTKKVVTNQEHTLEELTQLFGIVPNDEAVADLGEEGTYNVSKSKKPKK